MSSGFPISITWSAGSPPVDVFNQLASAATKLDSALQASGQNFDKFGQTVQQIESPLGSVGDSMGTLEGSMSGLEGSLGGAAGSMGEFAGSTEELNGSISETGGFVQDAAGGMDELSSGASDSGSAMGELGGAVEETNTGFGDLTTGLEDTGTGMTDLSTATEDTTTGLADMATGVEDTVTVTEDLVTATEDSATGLGDMSTAADDSATSMGDFSSGTEDAVTATSGLVEGIDPLNTELETMNTDLGDAATSGDTFSGALGGMNATFPGVNGGLTDANLLTRNLAGGMGDTSSASDTANASIGRLGIGMGAIIGTGVMMFNAFDNISDAQFNVDRASIALDKSLIRLDKSMITMGKTIAKLNQDSAGHVSGLAELNAAYAAFKSIVDSGVTSGTEFDKALQRLRAAQDNANASTAVGTGLLSTLGPQIDTAAANAAMYAVKGNDMANSLEAQNEAMANMVQTIIPGMLGGFSGVFTAMSGWRESIDLLKTAKGKLAAVITSSLIPALVGAKGAIVAAGAAISGSILPVLAAIAVPVGIAVAAIGAFVAAVTAIRANLGVFDELGTKVGEVFPQMKTFLEDARQSFINLSDGINSAISFILGGIDSFAGGTTNLKAQWEGFTGTLPQGTGELGNAGKAMGQLGHITSATGEQIKIGATKWTNMNGTLVAFGGAVKVAAGGWHELSDGTAVYTKAANEGTAATQEVTTAMDAMGPSVGAVGFVLKEQSVNYSELTNVQKLNVAAGNSVIESLTEEKAERAAAVAEAQFYLTTIRGITPVVGASGAMIVGMSNALRGQTQAHFDAVSAATAYVVEHRGVAAIANLTETQVLALAESIKEEEKAAGKATEETAKHVQALEKMQEALADTNAELAFYADAVNMANRLQLEFNTGVADAKKAIQDETFALAKMAGELSVWNDAQQRAVAIGNAFNRGIFEQQKASQGLVTAYAQALGKLQELERQLSTTASTVLAFNTGIVEGKIKALEFTQSLAKSAGEAIAFGAELRNLAQEAGVGLQSALSMSTEQLQDLLGAMALAPEAVDKAIRAFDELGQKIVDSLADAAKEGHDEFMDEIDKLQEELGVEFSDPIIQKLEVEADIENAKKQVQGLLGILAATMRNQPLEVALKTQAAQDALSLLRQKVTEAARDAPAAFGPLQSALDKLATTDFSGSGITKLPAVLAEIVVASSNLEGGMQGAITQFNGLFQSVAQGAGGMEALKSAFAGVGLSLDTTSGQIKNASGVVVAELGKMGPAATGAATEIDAGLLQMSASGDATRDAWARDMQIMFLAVDQFGKHAQTMAITVSGAYSNMATNVTASLNRLASGIIIVITSFTRIQTDSQRMASTVSGSFSNMASNTISSMNRMASGIIIIITSFTRITSEAGRMNQAVSNAMNQMASRTTSFASSFSSAMSRVSSSAATATSKVKALQSAINALKSKTITITTIIRTVRQTVFAAQGGAFIQSNPGKVGPLSVSEFGQKELVTVTPLQGPGRNAVKGVSSLLNEAAEKKRRRTMDEDREETGERRGRGRPEMRMMRELPIVIQVDGREITRVVNRRMFEESDALT